MRVDRDRLIFLALCVLDQAVDDCAKAPLKPSFSIQLALASLYALGRGERWMFDKFWKVIHDPMEGELHSSKRMYLRCTYARSALSGIARSVGVELTADAMARLSDARRKRS